MSKKAITLKKEFSTASSVRFAVYDERGRRRCALEMDFSRNDLEELQGKGLSAEEAEASYQNELREMISSLIGPDWECSSGWEDVMDPVYDEIKRYYAG